MLSVDEHYHRSFSIHLLQRAPTMPGRRRQTSNSLIMNEHRKVRQWHLTKPQWQVFQDIQHQIANSPLCDKGEELVVIPQRSRNNRTSLGRHEKYDLQKLSSDN